MLKERFTYLIVPGLKDSGTAHWQSLWQRQFALPRVAQSDWHAPNIDTWATTLERYVREQRQRVILLAHSFGSLATVQVAAKLRERIAAALLVAPADPAKFDLAHRLPVTALPFPSILVASTNDPWMDLVGAHRWATHWDSQLVNLGPAGHINAESGYGPWSKGWSLVETLTTRARATSNVGFGTVPEEYRASSSHRYAVGE